MVCNTFFHRFLSFLWEIACFDLRNVRNDVIINDIISHTFDLNEAAIVLILTALQKWMERTKDEDNRQDGPVGYDFEHFRSTCL